MNPSKCDVAVVGGGIVGLATALALTRDFVAKVVVLEAENRLAAHQTGHNSGVIHSGLYYKPGSLKARNCVAGREALYDFCAEHGIPHERCGKIVVAADAAELPALDELERRGRANGLQGLRRLTPEEVREREPHVASVGGLFVAETGIVDYTQVALKYADLVRAGGGEIITGARLRRVVRRDWGLVLETAVGEFSCGHLINCAGLQSDRVARMCGARPDVQIVPFRGEYYELAAERRGLIKHLVYPTPDPRFPFLGVHFTRMIGGGVEAGPNAVLAFKREGYHRLSVSVRDLMEMAGFPGFWRLIFRHGRTGLGELYRSFSKRAFSRALQRIVPELRLDDLKPAGAGVRAQAVERSGALVDDFRIVQGERTIHVLNAPSPAATASLSIGRTVAETAAEAFGFAKVAVG
jgi:L-2-hydroxyglutarate oxidase